MGDRMTDVFTAEDLEKAAHHETLGPAYFASRRVAETLMLGAESDPLKSVVKKCTEEIKQAAYAYIEAHILSDLECNLQHHIQCMTERSVQALLTGEEWAMRQYPFAKYHDGEAVRAAVAKHGGEPLLLARIADLEKRIDELKQQLEWARR